MVLKLVVDYYATNYYEIGIQKNLWDDKLGNIEIFSSFINIFHYYELKKDEKY